MDLNSKNVLEVLKNLIGGNLIETPFGTSLSVDNRKAFLFSAITGASYFENQIYPFSPKGLLKVFYNALNYNFVTGIFDNSSLKNTPYYLVQSRNYLNNGDKKIIPIEINSEQDFREKLSKNFPNNSSDFNILFLKIDLSKKGYGLESFMEYLACIYYSQNGYITENQIPLSHALGSPDFGGYSLGFIQDPVENNKVLSRGFNLIELSMLRSFPNRPNLEDIKDKQDRLIVGEAKTSTTIMEMQLLKYLSSGYFDDGIEIHPEKKESTNNKYDMLTIEDSKVKLIVGSNAQAWVDLDKQLEYKKWLESYFNSYLLANYNNDELNLLAILKINKKIDSQLDIEALIRNVSFEEHLTILKGFIKNGTFK